LHAISRRSIRIAFMPELSQLARSVKQSEIRVMSVECEKVKGINLAQGICDTETPLPVRTAAKVAIDGGGNSYTRLDGIAELRRAIARKMREYNQVECDPEREVVADRKSTRLNSSHQIISYAVFCLKKKKIIL